MNETFVHATIVVLLVLACFVLAYIVIIEPYIASENQCKNFNMELDGWTPGGQHLTCKTLENEYVIKIRFEKINGKYYPIKEAK